MREISRFTRTDFAAFVPVEDVVLMHDDKQLREWGFAFVVVGAKVQRTDIKVSLTDEEFMQFAEARMTERMA